MCKDIVPTISIPMQGVDFFFSKRSHAQRFLDFLHGVVPLRYRTDKQLVSHNEQNATYNYKYTFSVEIVPICKVRSPKGCPSLPTCQTLPVMRVILHQLGLLRFDWGGFCVDLQGGSICVCPSRCIQVFPLSFEQMH